MPHETLAAGYYGKPLLDAVVEHNPGDDMRSLMTQIGAGHGVAFEALYKATAAHLKAVSHAVLRSSDDADEIVGDVFAYVWSNANRYDEGRGSVLAWLTVIARSRSIDRLRSRRWVTPVNDDELPDVAGMEGPDEWLNRLQQINRMHGLLATMSPLRRQLISLAFFRGLRHDEISGVVDLPLGTVKSHIRRTLIDIRAALPQ